MNQCYTFTPVSGFHILFSLGFLHQPPIAQGHIVAIANDQVIQQFDIDEFQGLLEFPGDHRIAVARFSDSGRVIMRDNNRRGIM